MGRSIGKRGSNMMYRTAIACVAVVILAVPCAWGQQAAKAAQAPKQAARVAQAVKVTVISTSGIAHKRRGSDAKAAWAPIKAGDVLDDLTVIRTGLGAKVVLKLADRGAVTVRSATKLGIKEFCKDGGQVKARLGLKYGSMRAQVDSSRGPNDFQVATPVATLSVRGTGGILTYSGDLGLLLYCTDKVWKVVGYYGGRKVYTGEWTTGDLKRAIEYLSENRWTNPGDPHGGLSLQELEFLRKFGSGRVFFLFLGGGNQTVWFPRSFRSFRRRFIQTKHTQEEEEEEEEEEDDDDDVYVCPPDDGDGENGYEY